MNKKMLCLDRSLEVLFLLLIFITPLSTSLSNLFIALLFILYIIKIIVFKNIKFFTPAYRNYIVVFFLFSLLSILKAEDIGLSIHRIISPIFKFIVFYFIAYDIVKEEKVRKYYNLIFYSGIVVFCYGFIIDFFTANNFFHRNNSNGTFAAFITIFFISSFLDKEKKLHKKVISLIGGLGGIALVTSYSRGASLAFLAGIIMWLIMYFIKFKKSKQVLMILMVLILVTILVMPAELINRFQHLKDIENYSNLRVRLLMWQSSLSIIKNNPLLGTGVGNFNSHYKGYLEGIGENISTSGATHYHPHNLYLYIASEQGLISLFIILAMLINVSKIAYINFIKSPAGSMKFILGLSLIGVLTVLATHSMVDSTFRHNQVGFYVILFVILNVKLYNQEKKIKRS